MKILHLFFFTLFQCETVLEIEPNNVKAHYRRGQSYLGIGEPDLALDDFAKVRFFLKFNFNHSSLNRIYFTDPTIRAG